MLPAEGLRWGLTILTIAVSTFPFVLPRLSASNALADSSCGSWKATTSPENDRRMKVDVITEASGSNCQGGFRFSNNTKVFGFGGYALDLRTTLSENADATWVLGVPRVEAPFLLPDLDIELHTVPRNPSSRAAVAIEGTMTVPSIGLDTTLYLLNAVLEIVPLPVNCVVPKEGMVIIALRGTTIVSTALGLALSGDFPGARQEFKQVLPEFYKQIGATAKEAGFSCLDDLLQEIAKELPKKPLIAAKLTFNYLVWIPKLLWDYAKHGTSVYASVSYQPASKGLIAYIAPDQRSIWTIQPDGTNSQRLIQSTDNVVHIAWSANGRLLAFTTFQPGARGARPYVFDVSTGHTKEIHPEGPIGVTISFFPDGKRLAGISTAGPATGFVWSPNQFVAIDIETGRVTPLVEAGGRVSTFQVTPDGSSLLISSGSSDPVAVIQRIDLSSKSETNLVGPDWRPRPDFAALSPDGRKLAYLAADIPTPSNPNQLIIADTDGTSPQVIFGLTAAHGHYAFSFSSDNSQLLFSRWVYEFGVAPSIGSYIDEAEVWVVNLDGSSPRKITEGLKATWQPSPVSLTAVRPNPTPIASAPGFALTNVVLSGYPIRDPNRPVGLTEPIGVIFSSPFSDFFYEVIPSTRVQLSQSANGLGMTMFPALSWLPGRSYQIIIKGNTKGCAVMTPTGRCTGEETLGADVVIIFRTAQQ